jgi:enamine deaminase RidA (YjgF/YER057c/UK114 family)
MENIAAAVRGGPFAFVSGIRGTVLPRTRERVIEETPEAFDRQTDVSNEIIKAIFAECGLGPDALLRVDTFLRDGSRAAEAAAIQRRVLGHDPVAATTVALPLSARGEIEITTLAAAKGVRKETHAATRNEPTTVSAGGFVFVGECAGLPDSAERAVLLGNAPAQLEHALRMLDRGLQRADASLASLVRIELYLRDIYKADALLPALRQHQREAPPTLIVTGAELDDCLEVKLNAIAIAG